MAKKVKIKHMDPDWRFNPDDFRSSRRVEDGSATPAGKGIPIPDDYDALIDHRFAGGLSEGERNDGAFTVAYELAKCGVPEEKATIFIRGWNQANDPPLSDAELLPTIRSAYQRSTRTSGPPASIGTGMNTLKSVQVCQFLKQTKDPEWQIENILPKEGMLFIIADAGVGKTWFVLDMAIAISRGTAWLSHFPTVKGRVLIIDEENANPLIKSRFEKLFKALDVSDGDVSKLEIEILSGNDINLSNQNGVNELDKFLEELKPDLVILDSFIRFHHGNENDASEMSKVLGCVKRWMQKFHCSFVICHHKKKGGAANSNPTNAYRGSSDILGSADAHLDMQPVKDQKGLLIVTQTKDRYGNKVAPFHAEIKDTDDGGIVVQYVEEATSSPLPDKLEAATEFIRSLIEDGEWYSYIEIEERGRADGHARDKLVDARDEMIDSGEVVVEKEGRKTGIRLKPSSVRSGTLKVTGPDDDEIAEGAVVSSAPEEPETEEGGDGNGHVMSLVVAGW